MPAKSQKQQKFMGMVYALKKHKINPSSVSERVKKAAGKIKTKSAKEFAQTKSKSLPSKMSKGRSRGQ